MLQRFDYNALPSPDIHVHDLHSTSAKIRDMRQNMILLPFFFPVKANDQYTYRIKQSYMHVNQMTKVTENCTTKWYKEVHTVHLEQIRWNTLNINSHSTMVIAEMKEMPPLLLYHIPYYITMGYEKRYTFLLFAQCEEICGFEIQLSAPKNS